MALLLAIFHSKPGPFRILDEVDAALDEAIIGHFTASGGRQGADWDRASLALVIGDRKQRRRGGGGGGRRLPVRPRRPGRAAAAGRAEGRATTLGVITTPLLE